MTPELKEKVENILKAELEIYSMWVSGEVCGYKVLKRDSSIPDDEFDENDDDHYEELDSSWGYYGREACETEAKSIIDHYNKTETAA